MPALPGQRVLQAPRGLQPRRHAGDWPPCGRRRQPRRHPPGRARPNA